MDADGNRSILDAAGNIQFSEVIGGTSNFGGIVARPDPNLQRGYNWEYSASVQHELVPRISVTAGYYRRQFYNLQVTDNQNLSRDDWNTFTITTPTDTRLPSSGQAVTMYSLNTARVGTPTDNLYTFSDVNRSIYNGFELSANMRRDKFLLFGGVTTDRKASTECDGQSTATGNTARDNPNSLRFCDNVPPFRTTFKASAAYNLPYDFQVSGTFLAVPGPSLNANYTVTAAIAGRAIVGTTAGTPTITVNLVEPNTVFLDTRKQLDMRLGRTFRFGRYRTQGFMDVFNVLNAGTVTRANATYGTNPATNPWFRPQTIMDGRYVRFGMQMSF